MNRGPDVSAVPALRRVHPLGEQDTAHLAEHVTGQRDLHIHAQAGPDTEVNRTLGRRHAVGQAQLLVRGRRQGDVRAPLSAMHRQVSSDMSVPCTRVTSGPSAPQPEFLDLRGRRWPPGGEPGQPAYLGGSDLPEARREPPFPSVRRGAVPAVTGPDADRLADLAHLLYQVGEPLVLREDVVRCAAAGTWAGPGLAATSPGPPGKASPGRSAPAGSAARRWPARAPFPARRRPRRRKPAGHRQTG